MIFKRVSNTPRSESDISAHMKNSEIAKLFRKIKSFGLFTNSRTHEKVYKKLVSNPDGDDGARFIATTGIPEGEWECSECRRQLPADRFRYFQTRVKGDGSLMRANALCDDCSAKLNRERAKLLSDAEDDIPPTPVSGAKCPRCGRSWPGKWHLDHDYNTGKFRRWLCGNCNMTQSDRRTPAPE